MTRDAVAEFLAWAEDDLDRSGNTIARYRAVLSQIDDPVHAPREMVEAWWATRTGMSPATRANELACLRSFYKWAARFDHRPDDPTRRLTPPKVPNKIPRPIGERDLHAILDHARTTDRPDLYRAIALGAYGGLRAGEAATLDWSMLDLEARRGYVRGKGRKERVIGLNPVLVDKLLPECVGNVVTAGATPYSQLVLTRKLNRFIQATLYSDDRPMGDTPITYHSLRKRWATLAIAKTGDIHAVASAAGWSSIETAASYAVVGDDTLDAIAAAVV